MALAAKFFMLAALLSLAGGVADMLMNGGLSPLGLSPGGYLRFSMTSALVSISITVITLAEKK